VVDGVIRGVAAVTVTPGAVVVVPAAAVTVVVLVGVRVGATVGVATGVTVGVAEELGAALEVEADGEVVADPLAVNVTSTQYWLEFQFRVGKALLVPYA
jgi:heme/copper-type cytochrome/quinol oxidase subunit 2